MRAEYIVGIDEVGRGPLAGPVAVCAVVIKKSVPEGFLKGIRNSKAISGRARELWYKKALDARKAGQIEFAVSFSNASHIDTHGIGAALRACIARSLSRLKLNPAQTCVLLDGSIKAPPAFKNQCTIIKGDEKVPIIALASVIAKVRRDRCMRRYAKQFPGYGFEKHVGYGTAGHYRAIRRYGLCELHRRSFLENVKLKNPQLGRAQSGFRQKSK